MIAWNRKFDLSKEELGQLYWGVGLSQQRIADKIGLSQGIVYEWMKRYGIKRRTRSESRLGERNPFFGKHHSIETRRILSDKHKGSKMPISTREKISAAMKKRGVPHLKGKSYEEIHGKARAKELRDKLRRRFKGKKNPFYGRHHSEETKRILREKIVPKTTERWKNLEYKESALKKMALGSHREPTTPERRFIEICQKYNLPLRYVGDGQVWIAGKNPDFIGRNGRKLVVELFTPYWHSTKYKYHRTYNGTIQHYAEQGYDCLILWNRDVIEKSEGAIASQVSEWLEGRGK